MGLPQGWRKGAGHHAPCWERAVTLPLTVLGSWPGPRPCAQRILICPVGITGPGFQVYCEESILCS